MIALFSTLRGIALNLEWVTSYSCMFPFDRGKLRKKKPNGFDSIVCLSGEWLAELQGPVTIEGLKIRVWGLLKQTRLKVAPESYYKVLNR